MQPAEMQWVSDRKRGHAMTHTPNNWPILLVDDEEDIRDVLGVSIADMGYTVHTTKTATSIDIFRKIDPPIVMTDIKMPGIDRTRIASNDQAREP